MDNVRIQFENRSNLSKEKLKLFAVLLQEFLPIVDIPTVNHLGHVIFITNDKNNMERTVNEVIKKGNGLGSYTVGSTVPPATAIPSLVDGELRCTIVVSEHEVNLLTPDHYHPWNLVSSLLEELFHVRIYSSTWEWRRSLHSSSSFPAQERDLFVACSNFHDEYAVSRLKTSVLTEIPLVDVVGGLSIAYPAYGALLAPILNQAAQNFKSVVQN